MNDKIKLVVCDLDGTLLYDDKNYPKNFLAIVEQLKKIGVNVAIASGKSVNEIKKIFPEIEDILIYIGGCGAEIECNRKILHKEIISLNSIIQLTRCVELYPDTIITCWTKNFAYTNDVRIVNKRIDEEVIEVMNNDFSIIDEPIIRCCMTNEKHAYDIKKNVNIKEVRLIVNGGKHIDVLNENTDKLFGVKKVCCFLGITLSNVMAFGDDDNDVKLLEALEYSYAVENARPCIKNTARFICDSNNNNGVSKTLINVFGLEI